MNFLACLFAVVFVTVAAGFVFLWAGITYSLMIDALVYNESIRLFTYTGLGLGGLLGCIGVWKYERKRDG